MHMYNLGTTTFSMTLCLSVTALLPILERTVFLNQLALTSIPPTALTLLMAWAIEDMEELTARYTSESCHMGNNLLYIRAVMQTIARASIWPCPFVEYVDATCVHAYLDIAFLI